MKKMSKIFTIMAMTVMLAACGNNMDSPVSADAVIVKEKNPSNIEGTKSEVRVGNGKHIPAGTEQQAGVSANTTSTDEKEAVTETEVMAEDIIQVIPMDESVMYANTDANVRENPGTNHPIIGFIEYGEEVSVNGYTESGWYSVVYDGNYGFVNMKLLQDLQPVKETPAVEQPVNTTEVVYTDNLCTGLAKEIFDATNAEREAAGLEPLIWDDRLAEPANVRANEIITNFSHYRDDGTKCYSLSDLIWGENIARGPHATGAEFLEHWMASEGHKENILQEQYKTMGVGTTCTEQGDTAVQLFGVGN